MSHKATTSDGERGSRRGDRDKNQSGDRDNWGQTHLFQTTTACCGCCETTGFFSLVLKYHLVSYLNSYLKQ